MSDKLVSENSSSKKNNILISGYYGFGNAGDDAVLESMVAAIKREYPELLLTVLSKFPVDTPLPDFVRTVPRANMREVIGAISNSNIVISGGGGLIQDTTSFSSLCYYLGILFVANMMGKKTMVFSQGVGPLNRSISRYIAKLVLNGVNCITVRDNAGRLLLEEIMVNKPVTVTADPVFLMELPGKKETAFVWKGFDLPETTEDIIALVVRDWPGINEVIDTLSKAIIDWTSRASLPCRIIVLPFQLKQDLLPSKTLAEKLSSKVPVTLISQEMTPKQFLSIISQTTFVVSMRLHALIFAAISDVPFLGLAYDPKVETLAKNFNQPFVPVSSMTVKVIIDLLENVWINLEENKKLIANVTSKYRSQAKDAVHMLGELWRS